jgi:nitroreductase
MTAPDPASPDRATPDSASPDPAAPDPAVADPAAARRQAEADPRTADPAAHPADGSWAARARHALAWAVLAPSGHNTQPWLFHIADDGDPRVEVHADRRRALPVVDPEDRELAISCGAAAEALVVALRRFGLDTTVGGPDDPVLAGAADGLAVVRPAGAVTPSGPDRVLFDALTTRQTVRTAFGDEPVAAPLVSDLMAIAMSHGAELVTLEDRRARRAVGALVAEGDRRQFDDPSFRRELAAWVHSRRAASHDGMSGAAFGMPDRLSAVGALVIRTFDLGRGIAAADEAKIADGSPLLAVLATPGDAPADWVTAGRALMRVLLTAAAAGIDAGYLNQPIEVADLRPRLADVAGVSGAPQLLLRLGRRPADAEPLAPSVRRPVAEVLV